MTEPELYRRILDHRLDTDEVALPFCRRLARDNGWSLIFAQQAIEEYRKFIYLICSSGRMLTPSDAVDQVWHLHLTYSRDYWEVFCPQVLGRKVHHGPTRGGPEEAEKYKAGYAETLDLYRQTFGEPPSIIWLSVAERFRREPRFLRIDTSRLWLIPKAPVQMLVMSGLGVLILTGCAALQTPQKLTEWLLWGWFALSGVSILWGLSGTVGKGFKPVLGYLFWVSFLSFISFPHLEERKDDPWAIVFLGGFNLLLLALITSWARRGFPYKGDSGSSGCGSSDSGSGCGSGCGGGD